MKRIPVFALLLILTMLFAACSDNSSDFTSKSYASEDTEITAVNIDVRDRTIEVSLSADNQCISTILKATKKLTASRFLMNTHSL